MIRGIAMTPAIMAQLNGWRSSSLQGREVKSTVGSVALSLVGQGRQHCLVATVSIRTASMSLVCVSTAMLHSLPSSVFNLLCDLDTSAYGPKAD